MVTGGASCRAYSLFAGGLTVCDMPTFFVLLAVVGAVALVGIPAYVALNHLFERMAGEDEGERETFVGQRKLGGK